MFNKYVDMKLWTKHHEQILMALCCLSG